MLRTTTGDSSLFVFDFPRKMALKLDPFMTHELTNKSPPDPFESGSPRHNSVAPMDKSTLRVHLTSGNFNTVKFGDATDIKVTVFLSKVLNVKAAMKILNFKDNLIDNIFTSSC